MKAREITEAGKEALRSGRFQMVRVNYANPGACPWVEARLVLRASAGACCSSPCPLRSGPTYVANLRGQLLHVWILVLSGCPTSFPFLALLAKKLKHLGRGQATGVRLPGSTLNPKWPCGWARSTVGHTGDREAGAYKSTP